MRASTQDLIAALAETITAEVRPDEMEMIRESDKHSGGSEILADGDLLSFGSPHEMVLLFDVTKTVLSAFSLELVKAVGSDVAKRIMGRWSTTHSPSSQDQNEDVQSLLNHYEASLRKHGFNRLEARQATDCLSRELLANPKVMKLLLAG